MGVTELYPRTLTAEEFWSMSPQQRKLRRLQWRAVVDMLGLDHERRYHSRRHAIALDLELRREETP